MPDYDKYAPMAAKWLLPNGEITDRLPIAAAGGGDMEKAVYDTDDDGKVDAAEVADSVAWSGVTGKPSSFPPSTHTHAISDITNLQNILDSKLTATKAEAQADSEATDVAGLVSDFNALLAKLRAAGIMSS
ncbi:head fiber protein [Thermoactinomyces vulgaris]|jgi:hypothetical protein|uniref:head fiber protein n=1 Tax=Thermoactinomyces vulgaris TaxID=2026 RepID=UPI00363AF2D4